MSKKVVLYIATSLDGFIATKDLSVSWLDKFNNSGEDYGYTKFNDSVDTVIVGNTTLKQFPDSYPDKECFVFSRHDKGQKDNITYVS
jgi:dihydrofolate reductase